MPNYVINICKFNGEQEKITEILEKIRCKDPEKFEDVQIGSFDFNEVIPMPQSLDIESGSRTFTGIELYLTSINPNADWFSFDTYEKVTQYTFDNLYNKLSKEKMFVPYRTSIAIEEIEKIILNDDVNKLIDLGYKACGNMLNYGATTWYDWCCNNWNTKWNAIDSQLVGSDSLYFQTAWSPAVPVILKLSEMYPDIAINFKWADEDIGSNCGEINIKAGKYNVKYLPKKITKKSILFACNIWECDPSEYIDC